MANMHAKRSGARPQEKRPTATETKPVARPVSLAASTGKSVEKRAYEIYMKRVSAGAPGSEVGDWLQAESELRSEEE